MPDKSAERAAVPSDDEIILKKYVSENGLTLMGQSIFLCKVYLNLK